MNYRNIKIYVENNKISLKIEASSNADAPLPVIPNNYNLEKLHLQIRVSKIFQKVLNIRRTMVKSEIEIFDREDFVILGNMLSNLLTLSKDEENGKNILMEFFDMYYKEVIETPDQSRIRLFLEFDKNARELAELPWEYIRYKDTYLGAHPYNCVNLMRKIPLGAEYEDRQFTPPNRLSVILILADPGTPPYQIDQKEKNDLIGMLEHLKKRVDNSDKEKDPAWQEEKSRFNFRVIESPHRKDLIDRLKEARQELDLQNEPYIVHLFGHARPDAVALAPQDEYSTEPDWVSDKNFAALFDKLIPSEKPPLFVMTACDSGKIVNFTENRGVAFQLLVQQKMMAVLAMQNEVLSSVAFSFMEKMYQALLDGADIAEAVTRGRSFLGADYFDEPYSNNAFGSPILFVSTDKLLHLIQPATASEEEWVKKICKLKPKPPCREPQFYHPFEKQCKICGGDLEELGAETESFAASHSSSSDATSRSTKSTSRSI